MTIDPHGKLLGLPAWKRRAAMVAILAIVLPVGFAIDLVRGFGRAVSAAWDGVLLEVEMAMEDW